jgi:hypothetical protein
MLGERASGRTGAAVRSRAGCSCLGFTVLEAVERVELDVAQAAPFELDIGGAARRAAVASPYPVVHAGGCGAAVVAGDRPMNEPVTA